MSLFAGVVQALLAMLGQSLLVALLLCLVFGPLGDVSNPVPVPLPEVQGIVLRGYEGQIRTMAFAPDGRIFVCQQGGQLRVVKNGALLATADSRGIAQVWDATNGQPLGQPINTRQAESVVFSADGNYLATVSDQGPTCQARDQQNGDDERPRIVHHEKARRGDPSGATGDAADDGLRAGDIVVAKGRRGAIGISARSAGGIDA